MIQQALHATFCLACLRSWGNCLFTVMICECYFVSSLDTHSTALCAARTKLKFFLVWSTYHIVSFCPYRCLTNFWKLLLCSLRVSKMCVLVLGGRSFWSRHQTNKQTLVWSNGTYFRKLFYYLSNPIDNIREKRLTW